MLRRKPTRIELKQEDISELEQVRAAQQLAAQQAAAQQDRAARGGAAAATAAGAGGAAAARARGPAQGRQGLTTDQRVRGGY